jgi:small subunit ribosomal protein S18
MYSMPKGGGFPRKPKRKFCQFCADKQDYIDYKDVNLLRKFMSDRGKIRARRVTGNCSQHQRDVATAIKNAREMALLPYASRVTQTRGPKRGDGERGGRRERDRDLPAPDTAPMDRTEVEPEVVAEDTVDADAVSETVGAGEEG